MPKRNNGPHIHYRKDREQWEVREFTGGRRKRHATGLGSREDAERELVRILAKQTPEKCLSIGQIITYYINEHVPTVARPDVAIINLERVIPFWASLGLNEISQSKSLEYFEYRKKEYIAWQKKYYGEAKKDLTAASIRRELEQLQAAINFAYKNNKTSSNPFIWKPEKGRNKERWLTRSEAAKLLWQARKSSSDYLPLFILIGLYTGARMSAILKLRWTDIDLKSGLIDFTKHDNRKKKGAKTRIPPRLLLRLKQHRKRGVDLGYVIHINQSPILRPNKAFNNACKKAGIHGVTIHTLRHTCASWLVQKNVSFGKVAKHLGHTSARMIEQTYGHLSPDHMDEVMEAFTAPNTAPKHNKEKHNKLESLGNNGG